MALSACSKIDKINSENLSHLPIEFFYTLELCGITLTIQAKIDILNLNK